MMKIRQVFAFAALATTVSLAACGSQEASAAGATDGEAAISGSAGAASGGVEATATVIEVKMVTDGAGNYFEPAAIVAKRGDVLRFTLVSGVHNVSFPADKNPGAQSLPEASPYLQLAGQSYDMIVDSPVGEYTFQCDPHAVLGMVGTLKVE